ncbi:MAG: HAMP domain-containing histidine kinase [Lachnospiraceae bacterium]|nr:HAMP domain-containing histidine kinase [Lachnospiraceae bacterium]
MKKTTPSDKLSVIEIFLLLSLLLCYGATLCFIILDSRMLLILFFILHSCLTLVFLLVSHDRLTSLALRQTDDASRRLTDELQTISQYTEEIAALKQERDRLLSEKEQADARYGSLQKETKKLSAALEQEREQRGRAAEAADPNNLLPQKESPVDLDIIAAARSVVEEMSSYSRQAGVQVLVSSANDSLMVRADASFIRIMFRNIIDNSVKYMNRNGSLVITISNIGEDLFIVLKDNGEGLPLSETEHIFELNYQGSNRVSGNGLGLTQAKAIVEYYGGTIYAKSESGKGMGIYIQLPAGSR